MTTVRRSFIPLLSTLLITVIMVAPTTLGTTTPQTLAACEPTLISAASRTIALAPGQDYIIDFNATNLTLTPQTIPPASDGLAPNVIAAIAKAPTWIQPDLIRQFKNLTGPQPYADLLINTSTQLCDELAFSLAESPRGSVPTPQILLENAESLYQHDTDLDYVTILDINPGNGTYYSTLQYTILDNGTPRTILLPPDIYYWYIVSPRLTLAALDATYGPLWRNYVYDHNDLGYPLLKEKLHGIHYLWDTQAYYQPAYRLWTPNILAHPTAIEAISYWIGKTVPNPATGDRPGKPSIVAHEHNGWCGELQAIAIAAQRAALIPSIPACNVGEDHVWREFYDQGWHENDNWWSDTGGAVNEPDIYAYGWAKNMSAIYTWRGDDTIQDDTARYIHPQDRITVNFTVKDAHAQPIDGARITVLVTGPKDITYYKGLIWAKIQTIWDHLPPIMKGRLMTKLFGAIQQTFNTIPGEIHGVTITTWNYTDLDGHCSFQLGKNIDYLFLIQAGNLKKPWQFARHNTLRSLSTHTDKTFTILMPDIQRQPLHEIPRSMPSGPGTVHISYSTTASQQQAAFFTTGVGTHDVSGRVDCFLVDAQNLQKYQTGKIFVSYATHHDDSANLSIPMRLQDWYLVFHNPGETTTVTVLFSITASAPTTENHVQIVTPDTSLYSTPIVEAGDSVVISGIATGPVQLIIGCDIYNVTPVSNWWTYTWDTATATPGRFYHVSASCGNASDSTLIAIQDRTPPIVTIETPLPGEILSQSMVHISGTCVDAHVDLVQARIDNSSWVNLTGTNQWTGVVDCSAVSLSDHVLAVRAFDSAGLCSISTVNIVVNASGHAWEPAIHSVVALPAVPMNSSCLVFEANVTSGSPFSLASVVLWYSDGVSTTSAVMYRYADFPVQERHSEDPLANESNLPVFGCELGQFATGTNITYWVVARDTAGNWGQSPVESLTIG